MTRNVSTRRAFITFSKPVWELSGMMVVKEDIKPPDGTEVGMEGAER